MRNLRNEECCMSQPVQDALVSEAGSGMALPLLPTLVVAVIVSAASFLCQAPSAPSPEATASVSAVEAQGPQDSAPEAIAFVPAALAFGGQFPLRDDVAWIAEAAPRRAAPRVAAVKPPSRRPDAARPEMARNDGHKADGLKPDAARVAPVVAARTTVPSEPFEAASDEGLIPDLAIPFAPAISALTRAGSFVGTQSAAAGAQAVALGNVVTGLVDRLPLGR